MKPSSIIPDVSPGDHDCLTRDAVLSVSMRLSGSGGVFINSLENVKEHATLSARAHVDHGFRV